MLMNYLLNNNINNTLNLYIYIGYGNKIIESIENQIKNNQQLKF